MKQTKKQKKKMKFAFILCLENIFVMTSFYYFCQIYTEIVYRYKKFP